MTSYLLRKLQPKDEPAIFSIFKKSATIKEGLARTPEEITKEYIQESTSKTLQTGIGIIATTQSDTPVAVLLSQKLAPKTFTPTLTNLTLAVDPDHIGNSLSKKLFTYLIEEVKENHPEIHRIELDVRQTNQKAISIYESLGFKTETILKNRLLDSNGNLADDTMMAWIRN